MLSGNLHRRERTTRDYGAWLLCGLLLVLCANARLASYQIHPRTLKLATTQACLDGAETLRKLPKAEPLVWWQAFAIFSFVAAALYAVLLTTVLPETVPFRGFDPDTCLRPPPVR